MTNTVALIPARAGSKSVPNKNIAEVGGVPLVGRAIQQAQNTPEVVRIIVSTDGEEIAKVAQEYGAEVQWRPGHLAEDSSLVIDAIRHHFEVLVKEDAKPDVMVLLEPTTPLRKPQHISECIQKLINENLDTVATFREGDLNPHRAWLLDDAGKPSTFMEGATPWLPRQALPAVYQLAGAVYAFRPELIEDDTPSLLFGKTGAVIISKKDGIDIDDPIDLDLVRLIAEKE